VTDDGCLECPWHALRHDIGTDKMAPGPQDADFGDKESALEAAGLSE
jgi:hypothetical protein